MARWWKRLPALTLAVFGFGGTVHAQQYAEPPYSTAPAYGSPGQGQPLYSQGSPQANSAYYEQETQPEVMPVLQPVAPPPYALQPGYYYPPTAKPAGMEGQYAPAPSGQQGNSNSGKKWVSPLFGKSDCGCNGGGGNGAGGHANGTHGNGYGAHPIHHFLLLDCYGHHDEFGCSSLRSELRFAFGSCKAYFGETCSPYAPTVPVPPGYSLPPGPRTGPQIPVPPGLAGPLSPGTGP